MYIMNIIPPQWVNVFPQGKFRMVLAHWVLQYPAYAKKVRDSSAYLLMDNGAFEGCQVPLHELNKALSIVEADEVVLPDVMGDAEKTLKRSWDALGHLAVRRVMFNAQAHSAKEWQFCLDAWMAKWNLSKWKDTYTLGLCLSNLNDANGKGIPGTRGALMEQIASVGLPVHMLGVRDTRTFAEQELPKAHELGLRGVDTSLASALGAERKLLTTKTKKVHLKDPSEYETLDMLQRRLIHLNIAILNSWVEAGKAPIGTSARVIRETASHWEKYWQVGFAPLVEMMKACGMPLGRYALLSGFEGERDVRSLKHFERPTEEETLIVVEY